MLEDVGEHDDVEAAGVLEALERDLATLQAQDLARVAGGRAGQLEPDGVVAAPARLVEQQAVTAADVEQAPGRHERADAVQEPPRRRTPARLLSEVGVVGHLAVELDQLRMRGQRRLLDRAALHAREQLAVAPGFVAGGRQRVGRDRHRAAGQPRAQLPRADTAGQVHGAEYPGTWPVAARIAARAQADPGRAPSDASLPAPEHHALTRAGGSSPAILLTAAATGRTAMAISRTQRRGGCPHRPARRALRPWHRPGRGRA